MVSSAAQEEGEREKDHAVLIFRDFRSNFAAANTRYFLLKKRATGGGPQKRRRSHPHMALHESYECLDHLIVETQQKIFFSPSQSVLSYATADRLLDTFLLTAYPDLSRSTYHRPLPALSELKELPLITSQLYDWLHDRPSRRDSQADKHFWWSNTRVCRVRFPVHVRVVSAW